MDSPLVQQQPNGLYHKRPPKGHLMTIPLRWHTVLALHLGGASVKEVAKMTGYSQATCYCILRRPEVQLVRQRMMEDVQQEFEALWPKVVDNIRVQLSDADPQIQLAAQQQWLKASGKFQPVNEKVGKEATAEEVVARLLQQQINIQVNVGKDVE